MGNDSTSLHAAYLQNLSIKEFNAMQREVISKSATSVNLTLLAPTGSGKTLAFLISVIDQLKSDSPHVQALIVAPSRELSLQIEDVFRSMKTLYKASCVYGGHAVKIEENSLEETPAVVIGTPGRIADHLMRKSFDASHVRIVVLDEFDKSLQMGFHEQLKVIFKSLSGKQRHLLTSATKLEEYPDFLPFNEPDTINYLSGAELPGLELRLVKSVSAEKPETLLKLVAGFGADISLVFCNHREAVERLSFIFRSNGIEHGILHGAMEQIDREKNLIKFRGGAVNVLLATDLASRGLDIPEIKHVVHYQLPVHEEAFVHRNGRTARMHAEGLAYLILADDESLPNYIDKDIKEVILPRKLTLPPPPLYACVYISAGKKDKISKGDIVGLFTKKGSLTPADIGLIITLDHSSYVAVRRKLVSTVLDAIRNERLKKQKVKIELAY